MKLRIIFFVAVALLAAAAASAAIPHGTPFEAEWNAARIEASPGTPFQASLTIQVPEGHYLYADETDLDFASLEGLFITAVHYPKPTPYVDPFLGKKVQIYRGDVTINVEGKVPAALPPGEKELTALVRFRGCSPTLCYRPEERELAIRVAVLPRAEAPAAPKAPEVAVVEMPEMPSSLPQRLGIGGLLQVQDFTDLLERGTLVAIAVVFLAGILTSLTPCVWPIIPLVLLVVGVHPHKRLRENVLLSASLIAGLVLTYAALGMIAVAVGKNLGFLFQQRWFLALTVLFFVTMSLSMFGAFDIRMPHGWHARLHRLGGKGYRGALLAGIGMGLVASPCSGPVLAALLGYVALAGSYALGFVLLIIYGAGMGLIMLVLGTAYGELAGKLKGGSWMLWIRRALGILLLFPAAFYMGSLFHWTGRDMGPGSGPRIVWLEGEREALELAAKTQRPIILEFTAAWCPPCHALEHDFFSRADVVREAQGFVPLRIDATVETAEVRRVVGRYRVVGWPTVLFLSPEGRPYEDLRVSEYDPRAVEFGLQEAARRALSPSAVPSIESAAPSPDRPGR
jgi:thioredoxin:protein disulfide reductase